MRDVDWTWVRTWAGRIFFAALPLGVFMYLSAAPVIRPGGVINALPEAIGVGVIVATAITGRRDGCPDHPVASGTETEMIDRLLSMFGGDADKSPAQTEAGADNRLAFAAAALLIEAARMDDTIDEDERARIVELVRWRFKLDEAEASALVAEAEPSAETGHLQKFTAIICKATEPKERIGIVEMLWDVVYADGQVHHLESSLLRRLAGLLYVSDRDTAAARQRVRERYGLAPDQDTEHTPR